jgi:hypothetical protein
MEAETGDPENYLGSTDTDELLQENCEPAGERHFIVLQVRSI